jgi:hypothetical protein
VSLLSVSACIEIYHACMHYLMKITYAFVLIIYVKWIYNWINFRSLCRIGIHESWILKTCLFNNNFCHVRVYRITIPILYTTPLHNDWRIEIQVYYLTERLRGSWNSEIRTPSEGGFYRWWIWMERFSGCDTMLFQDSPKFWGDIWPQLLALKMEAVCSSITSCLLRTTRRYNTQDSSHPV